MTSIIDCGLDAASTDDHDKPIAPKKTIEILRGYARQILETDKILGEELLASKEENRVLCHKNAALATEKDKVRAENRVLRKNNEALEKRIRQLEAENARLDQLAHTDPLTGAKNRRGLDRDLGRIRKETGVVFSFDIDFFKQVNDRHEHRGGDHVLRIFTQTLKDEITNTLKTSLRGNDTIISAPMSIEPTEQNEPPKATVARVGGEEFVVVANILNPKDAHAIANRLRKAIEAKKIPFNGCEIAITSSIGYAALGDDFSESLAQADKNLYQAKRSGRNRAVGSLTTEENPTIYARRANPSRPYPLRKPQTGRHIPTAK